MLKTLLLTYILKQAPSFTGRETDGLFGFDDSKVPCFGEIEIKILLCLSLLQFQIIFLAYSQKLTQFPNEFDAKSLQTVRELVRKFKVSEIFHIAIDCIPLPTGLGINLL